MTTQRPRRRNAVLAALAALLLLLVGSGLWLTLRPAAEDADPAPGRPLGTDSADAVGPRGTSSDSAAGSTPATPESGGAAGATTPRPRGRAQRPAPDATAPAAPPGESVPAPSAPKPAAKAPESPWGRFVLVGEAEAQRGNGFGCSVDVDGDVAVIAAPGFTIGSVACGAAYVYERGEDRAWRLVQRLDSPRPDMHGFASCVRVSGTRIAVFGGFAVGQNVPAFRTYVRADGRWQPESEVRTPDAPIWLDATLDADEVVIGSHRTVAAFARRDGEWGTGFPILTPSKAVTRWFGGGVARTGDTLALSAAESTFTAVVLRRDRDGRFAHETNLDRPSGSAVALARGGNALICASVETPAFSIDERTAAGWTRVVDTRTPFPRGRGRRYDGLLTLTGRHPVAADGDLVVAAGRDFDAFGLLVRRADGWASARIEPPAQRRDFSAPSMWPAWHPDVAMSGRAVVVGTEWDGNSGRAWFFDVTDEDVAAAVPIVNDAGK